MYDNDAPRESLFSKPISRKELYAENVKTPSTTRTVAPNEKSDWRLWLEGFNTDILRKLMSLQPGGFEDLQQYTQQQLTMKPVKLTPTQAESIARSLQEAGRPLRK